MCPVRQAGVFLRPFTVPHSEKTTFKTFISFRPFIFPNIWKLLSRTGLNVGVFISRHNRGKICFRMWNLKQFRHAVRSRVEVIDAWFSVHFSPRPCCWLQSEKYVYFCFHISITLSIHFVQFGSKIWCCKQSRSVGKMIHTHIKKKISIKWRHIKNFTMKSAAMDLFKRSRRRETCT